MQAKSLANKVKSFINSASLVGFVNEDLVELFEG